MRGVKLFGVGIKDNDDITQLEDKDRSSGRKVIWRCPYYQTWMSLLRRSYSDVFKNKSKTYVGVITDERWHYFSSFKEWMQQQDWEGKDLDKDLISRGNKIYGPDTCCFITDRLNTEITHLKRKDKGLIGASFKKKNRKYQSQILIKGKKIYLGLYDSEMDAHLKWLDEKIKRILEIKQYENQEVHKYVDELLGEMQRCLDNRVEFYWYE